MYFYGFCQIVWLLTGTPLNFILFFKKIIYIFINIVLLPTSHTAFWKNFT